MSGATDGIRQEAPLEGATAKMEQASSLFAPEDETNGDIEMINISHKVSYDSKGKGLFTQRWHFLALRCLPNLMKVALMLP